MNNQSICEGCPLFKRNIHHRVCIPVPSEQIIGCIISRDPTSDFLVPLNEYKGVHPHKRGNLLLDAPPLWLYNQIQKFMGLDPQSPEMKKLHSFLNYKCYWTHFHKCPTQKSVKWKNPNPFGTSTIENQTYPSFKYSNGEICANRWFDYEFEKFQLQEKLLIVLGRDVQKYFLKRPGVDALIKEDLIFFLPHPSSANCGNGWSWNRKKPQNDANRKLIKNDIKHLLFQIEKREKFLI